MMIHAFGFLSLSASFVLPWALTGLVQGQRITDSVVKDVLQSPSVQEMPLPSRKLISQASGGRTFYVSGSGNDKNSGLTTSSAFRTIQRAADLTNPGDKVYILNGVYKNAYRTGSVVNIKRSGRANAWITYQAYPGHRPKLQFNGWHGILLENKIEYIEINGLEVEGNNKNITLDYARSQRYNRLNPLTNGNGITIDGRKNRNGRPRHIRILNNKVHHAGGAGISAMESDYVTVDNNEVFNNAWYGVYGSSGISFLHSWPSDNNQGYKMFIRNNKVYNNRMYIPWIVNGKFQDGNGIILDRTNNDNISLGPYKGRTLVANNISYRNGGSGIHTFKSNYVDIVHNTTYLNNQTPEIRYGQIMSNGSDYVRVLNNILYSEPGKPINARFGGSGVTFNYNHNANSTNISARGVNDTSGNPLFRNAGAGDFRLNTNSPAINNATRFNSVTKDITGGDRVKGSAPDKGAYEIR